MIKYDLKCNLLHSFEGWFSSSGDYENQALKGLVTCPVCGNDKVERAIVAPSIKKSSIKTDLNKNPIEGVNGSSSEKEILEILCVRFLS